METHTNKHDRAGGTESTSTRNERAMDDIHIRREKPAVEQDGPRDGCRYWTSASGWNCPGGPLVLAYLSSAELAAERTIIIKALCVSHYEEIARLRDWRIVGALGAR